jgi:hypothetical protein
VDKSAWRVAFRESQDRLGGRNMNGDAIYFRSRASDERAAAEKAEHSAARQAHLDMAHRYDDLAAAIEEREKELGPAA